MRKHSWRVGVLSEFAPGLDTGVVGVTQSCLLGFNRNKGQEISLRLRTDDFEGFRHYRIIIDTMLHELAHMVHSNHDAPFHALNRQLQREYVQLDWRRNQTPRLLGRAAAPQRGHGAETPAERAAIAAAARAAEVAGTPGAEMELDLAGEDAAHGTAAVEVAGDLEGGLAGEAAADTAPADVAAGGSEGDLAGEDEADTTTVGVHLDLAAADPALKACAERLTRLIASVERECAAQGTPAAPLLQFLAKVVGNLRLSGGDKKFRSLKLESARMARAWALPASRELLSALGFREISATARIECARPDLGLLWIGSALLP